MIEWLNKPTSGRKVSYVGNSRYAAKILHLKRA